MVRQQITATEYNLLWQLAEGVSYDDLAAARGVAAGQLRVQVVRLRNRIREALKIVVQHLN